MTPDCLSSDSQKRLDWLEAEAHSAQFGEKGARLLVLPRAWTPPFVLISAGLALKPLNGEVQHFIETLAARSDALIVRSSVVGETIWERGTYESITVDIIDKDQLLTRLQNAVNKVVASAEGKQCGIIIQTYLQPDEIGEFGNLLRVSRTRDHWEYSVRSSDAVTETDRFNSQRDVAADTSRPLLARPGLVRARLFGSVAAWINNELRRGMRSRVNCEWIRSGERFYVVQIDDEDEDIFGINPMQTYVEPTISSKLTDGTVLLACDPIQRAKWDKLAVIDELYGPNSTSAPTLYCLPLDAAVDANRDSLLSDFQRLIGKDIVVRTSALRGEKKLNLPKSDCLTPLEATQFCLAKAREVADAHPCDRLAFVCHRYIASRASAWVRAEPNNPLIEVHGNWGLPDALQFGAFDIWDVHLPTEEVTEYANYKSHVLLLQEDGSWRYERVKNDIARYLSLARADVLDIARRSAEIAERLGKACNIMWFVGSVDDTGQEINVPWYWTDAHEVENAERGRHQILDIRDTADLSKVDAASAKHPRLALALRPHRMDLLRNNTFLAEVAGVALPRRLPIYIQGSTLAHAYYQLRKLGCIVIPAEERDHFRTRRQANFGKLVRDKIPDRIARQKETVSVAILPDTARTGFLVGKFIEEILEAREAPNSTDRTTELADIFEVLRAFAALSDDTIEQVAETAEKKRTKAGGFDNGKILIQTSISASKDADYSRDESLIIGAQPEVIRPTAYRIPFNWFGFAEIGQPRVLRFASTRTVLVLTLNRDSIDVELSEAPQQFELGL